MQKLHSLVYHTTMLVTAELSYKTYIKSYRTYLTKYCGNRSIYRYYCGNFVQFSPEIGGCL